MKLETLIEERDTIKEQFDEQTKVRSNAESEQIRLQGAYRTLTELIDREEAKLNKKGTK